MSRRLPALLFMTAFFLLAAVWRPAHALTYELIPPEGDLSRGQDIQFVIRIDTEGAPVTSAQVGLTYDTQYLQYLNAVPGDTMTSVTVSDLGSGKLLFSGNNTSGFTGSGIFANVSFRIIAGAPGSTELCVLWAPTPTPAAVATNPPLPTRIPTLGVVANFAAVSIGSLLLIFAGATLLLQKGIRFESPIASGKRHRTGNRK